MQLKSVHWFLRRRFLKFSICFLTNQNYLNNLGRGSPKEHSCQVILKSVQWFLTRRFLKFFISIYRENKPHPLAAMFFDKS